MTYFIVHCYNFFFKCYSFDLSIYQRILENNKNDNEKCFLNQYIRIISEGSCETEDWRNDAENSVLITGINYILTYIQTENSYFKL